MDDQHQRASLSFFAVFTFLGEEVWHDWDEAIYAQVAQEIAVLIMAYVTLGRTSGLAQPPLYFWPHCGCLQNGGINEFAARSCSAAFGFGVVHLRFGWDSLISWAAGVWACYYCRSINPFTATVNFLCQARSECSRRC